MKLSSTLIACFSLMAIVSASCTGSEERQKMLSENVAEYVAQELRAQLQNVSANDTIVTFTTDSARVADFDFDNPRAATAESSGAEALQISQLQIVVKPEMDKYYEKQAVFNFAMFAIFVPLTLILLGFTFYLIYIFKRNRQRNDIILHAIENGYDLPESFYTGHPSRQPDATMVYATTRTESVAQAQPVDETSTTTVRETVIPPLPANPLLFERGVRNLGIGFVVLLTLMCIHATPIAPVGLIWMIIGASQLLSYYRQKGKF